MQAACSSMQQQPYLILISFELDSNECKSGWTQVIIFCCQEELTWSVFINIFILSYHLSFTFILFEFESFWNFDFIDLLVSCCFLTSKPNHMFDAAIYETAVAFLSSVSWVCSNDGTVRDLIRQEASEALFSLL